MVPVLCCFILRKVSNLITVPYSCLHKAIEQQGQELGLEPPRSSSRPPGSPGLQRISQEMGILQKWEYNLEEVKG